MNVTVTIDGQSGKVTLGIPNRSLGGNRHYLDDLTMLDLIQIRAAADRAIYEITQAY